MQFTDALYKILKKLHIIYTKRSGVRLPTLQLTTSHS